VPLSSLDDSRGLERQLDVGAQFQLCSRLSHVVTYLVGEGSLVCDEFTETSRSVVACVINLCAPLLSLFGLIPAHIPREHLPRCNHLTVLPDGFGTIPSTAGLRRDVS
jgi:hypothetical protein